MQAGSSSGKETLESKAGLDTVVQTRWVMWDSPLMLSQEKRGLKDGPQSSWGGRT